MATPAGIDVRDHGALINGSADDTAAWQAAVAAAAGGNEIYMPAGTSRVTDTILIASQGIKIRGVGQGGSAIKFQPTADNKSLFKFENSNANVPMRFCGIRDIQLFSDIADADRPKTAIEIHDVGQSLFQNIKISPWFSTNSTTAVGINAKGREHTLFSSIYSAAGVPLKLSINDRDTLKDFDHFIFEHCHFLADVAPNPCVVIDGGVLIAGVYFIGGQNWVKGGLSWVDGAVVPRRSDNRYNLVIAHLKPEQLSNPTSDTGAIRIELNRSYPLRELAVRDSLLGDDGVSWFGVRPWGVRSTVLDGCVYLGEGSAIDPDSPLLWPNRGNVPGSLWGACPQVIVRSSPFLRGARGTVIDP